MVGGEGLEEAETWMTKEKCETDSTRETCVQSNSRSEQEKKVHDWKTLVHWF
jgi:hypothetical protein